MPYCIYTDRNITENDANPDHIIPLSLGGNNGFCIPSDKKFNSTIGTTVDGTIANDPLVMMARRNADARGHSKKPPVPVWRRSSFEGEPAQVTLGKDEIKVWKAKERQEISGEALGGKTIKSNLTLEKFSRIRFVSKVALGGAYFLYKDSIKTAINCNELRTVISLEPEQAKKDPDILRVEATFCDPLFLNEFLDSNEGKMYKFLCQPANKSVFIMDFYADTIGFHVGVLGMYMGSVFCPADVAALDIDEEYDLGHAILFGKNQSIINMPFRDYALRASEGLNDV